MARELTINGKKYLPSSVLSERFSYTPDYLTKLARDGKVEATRIGRQWFLNEMSLEQFSHLTDLEKNKRSEVLRTQRKIEREIHNKKRSDIRRLNTTFKKVSHASAMMQAAVVVASGLFLGSLGFLAYEQNLNSSAVLSAADDIVVTLGEHMVPDISDLTEFNQLAFLDFTFFFDWIFKGADVVEVEHVRDEGVVPSTDTAQVEVAEKHNDAILLLDASTTDATIADIRQSFSDEVEVTFDGEHTGVITPVFRERADTSYRFLLVPVTETSGN